METPTKDDLVPPGGMYVRLPFPAVKSLSYGGNRGAGRVLTALCLHLGKGNKVVFPGYKTIAFFAYISENKIKSALNLLIARGYISVEKKRIGKKFQNYYEILPKCFLEEDGGETRLRNNKLDSNKHWMCASCWNDVSPDNAEFVQERNWEGNWDNHWKHSNCTEIYNSRRIVEAARGLLLEREARRTRLQ